MVGITRHLKMGSRCWGWLKLDASNRNAVIGVAKEAISAETVAFEDGSEYVDFAPTAGVIAPNSYLVIITDGLAPAVNVSSLALADKRADWRQNCPFGEWRDGAFNR